MRCGLVRPLTLACGLGLAGTTAAAQPARVVIETCPGTPLDPEELLRLVSLELAPLGVTVTRTSTASLFLTVGLPNCGPNTARIELAVLSSKGHGAAATVDVGERRGVPRIVALAAAELVRTLKPPPARPPPSWRPSDAWEGALLRRAATRLEARRTPPPVPRLAVSLGVDAFPSTGTALSALSLDATLTASAAPVRLFIGGVARGGVDRVTTGDIEMFAAFGSGGLAIVGRFDGLAVEVGPRVLLGWGTARGRSSTEDVESRRLSGFLAEVWVDLGVRFRLSSSWSLGGRAGAGYVLAGLGAQSDGVVVAGVDGPALGVASTLSFEW